MNNDEIKRANRKALPKFLALLVVALVIGGVIGYFSGCGAASGGLGEFVFILKAAGAFFGAHIAPWLLVALAVIVPVACIPIYRSTKKLLAAWDGEDDEISCAADIKLSVVLWITSAVFIFSFFLIAASYSGGIAIFAETESTVVFFVSIAAFLVIMLETVIFQQKCVDATKQMNPEKKASVYDMKFQKKWLDDCDEAERLMIAKCAFKAYSVTNKLCSALAIVLALCALMFDIGFLTSLVVCLVWLVNISVYCKEAVRLSKAGNKIS